MPESSLVSETERVLAFRQREAQLRRQREAIIEGHIQGVAEARGELEDALKKYQEKVALAQREVRRHVTEDTVHFRTYLTMQTRMSGAIHQAIKRASSMDRMISASKADREDREREDQALRLKEARRTAHRDVQRMILPPSDEDDLTLLYGPDEVNHA